MEEERADEITEDESGELEDLRRYIEDFTSFLPLAFCMVNPLDYVLDSNDAFQEISGYEKMEVVGKNINFLFKNRGKLESFIARVASKKSVVEEEMTLVTKEKKEIPVKVSALSRRDEKEAFSGYFITISDITETKRFEEDLERKIKERTEELEKAKERLEESEKVLEIKIAARTRALEELNEQLEEKVKERTKEIEDKAAELEQKAEEMRETQTALLNLAEDTDKASREAEEEKEKTLAIINNFTDGLLVFDAENVLSLINPRAEVFLNVRGGDFVGKRLAELGSFSRLEPLVSILKKERKAVLKEELEVREDLVLEVSSVPVVMKKKNIGMLVILHDITREKAIERIKSEFVSVAAHQLRTPLAGIKWTLQSILEEEEEAKIPEEVVEFIKRAYEANDRMINLVNDLLNVTRIEEGRYVYEPKKMEVKEVMEPVIEAYEDAIKAKGLEFKIEEPEEKLPLVKVDEEKIRLVLQNFLDNAMKYTSKGRVTLSLEASDDGEEVKFTVSDTGVGIPEDQQKRLFNKFFRAANVQRMDTEGSGLGLFIAKNIVEAHGGEVGFSSKAGEGSVFFFTLPALQER